MYKIKRFTSIREMKKVTSKVISNPNESILKKIYGKPISQKTSAKIAKDEALRKLNASTNKKLGLKLDRDASDIQVKMVKDSIKSKRDASVKVGGRMKKFEDAMRDDIAF